MDKTWQSMVHVQNAKGYSTVGLQIIIASALHTDNHLTQKFYTKHCHSFNSNPKIQHYVLKHQDGKRKLCRKFKAEYQHLSKQLGFKPN